MVKEFTFFTAKSQEGLKLRLNMHNNKKYKWEKKEQLLENNNQTKPGCSTADQSLLKLNSLNFTWLTLFLE